jgi:hypothetical protein
MFFGQSKLSLCSINYAQCHQGVWSDMHFQALITFVLFGGEWSNSSLDHSSSTIRALARPTAGLGTVVKGIEPKLSSHPSNIHLMPSVFLFDVHIWSLDFRQFQATTSNFTFMWPCRIVTGFFVIKPNRCTNFTNLFCHENLHVSDSSSVHHQEFIHCTLSNGICHTGL